MMPTFRMSMTLGEARAILGEHAVDGITCPCCDQFVKVYRRPLHAAMARDLALALRSVGVLQWFHLPSVISGHPGDFAKLAHWNLIEPQPGERDDGSTRTGWWRITDRGEAWVHGRIAIPKYVLIYNGEFLGNDGDPVTISDALGQKFDFRELMVA